MHLEGDPSHRLKNGRAQDDAKVGGVLHSFYRFDYFATHL
jgi:hypothetical protein